MIAAGLSASSHGSAGRDPLLPSSIDPNADLTVWDGSSSRLTLAIMLGAMVIFLPLIIAYTAWVYRVLRGRVTLAHVSDNPTSAY